MSSTRGVLRLVTPNSGEVVTRDEAKRHLRVDFADDDVLIEGLVKAAVNRLDGPSGILGRSLIDTVWAFDVRGFPPFCGFDPRHLDGYRGEYHRDRHAYIELPLCGVSAIAAISYIDTQGAPHTLSPDVYRLITDNRFTCRVVLKPGQCWPSTQCRADAVTVTFTSGFGADSSKVPEGLKSAVKLVVGQLYRQRDEDTGVGPDGRSATDYCGAAGSLISSYRRIAV